MGLRLTYSAKSKLEQRNPGTRAGYGQLTDLPSFLKALSISHHKSFQPVQTPTLTPSTQKKGLWPREQYSEANLEAKRLDCQNVSMSLGNGRHHRGWLQY